jgi:hypothetical protein
MVTSKGTANYKTVTEFQDAMRLAYREAYTESPDDPNLKDIEEKWEEAAAARRSFYAIADAEGHASTSGQEATVADLKKTALRTEEEAEIALKKWYSNQWRGRQEQQRRSKR